jgi:hypothetical protein
MLQGLLRIALTSAVCVLLTFLAARLHVSIPGGQARERLSAEHIQPLTDIFEGVEVRQEFPAEGERIRSVELQLATFGRKNKGKLVLQVSRLVNGRWEELAVRTMRKRQLEDCAWQLFGFAPPLLVKQRERIALTLTANWDAANAISWWASPGVKAENLQLLVNGVPREGYAHFSVDYEPIQGKAGYRNMRPRLWRRLTVFLDPLGQAMLAGGFLLALLCFVHLSMHAPGVEHTSSAPTQREARGAEGEKLRRSARSRR